MSEVNCSVVAAELKNYLQNVATLKEKITAEHTKVTTKIFDIAGEELEQLATEAFEEAFASQGPFNTYDHDNDVPEKLYTVKEYVSWLQQGGVPIELPVVKVDVSEDGKITSDVVFKLTNLSNINRHFKDSDLLTAHFKRKLASVGIPEEYIGGMYYSHDNR